MRSDEDSPGERAIPNNWDVLHESSPDEDPVASPPPDADASGSPPTLNLLASSWADAVAALGVCTAALFGLDAAGHNPSLTALPWAVALGVLWWLAAAAALIMIRQATPGMLLAGVVFSNRVAPVRVAAVIIAAAVTAALMGLPNLLGPRRSPLALAAASRLESIPAT
jgi:hypothetical protein